MLRLRRMRMALVLAAAGVAAALAAVPAVPAAASPGAPQLAAGATAFAWGAGYAGQLGNGGTADQSSPVPVAGLPAPVVQVAAGYQASAALLSDGTVWVWGNNQSGILGNGTKCLCFVTAPQQVPGLSGVIQIDTNGYDTYAVGSDGTLWAWGGNARGQLGVGNTFDSLYPVRVLGLTGVTQVSAGGEYALALRSDGTVWSWGYNSGGQLGYVTIAGNTVLPAQVPGLSGIIQVSASGLSYAVRSDGTLLSWGEGTTTPAPVPGLARIVQVASDGQSTLALSSEGHVWAWGANGAGELGNGTTTYQSTPEQIGLTGIIQVAIGPGDAGSVARTGGNSAAVRYDGTLWTWGDDTLGDLGNGTCCAAANPVPGQVNTLAAVSQVATGWGQDVTIGSFNYTTVPSLTGDTTAQASQALQAVGLVLGTVYTAVDYSCNNIGTVMNQNPAAGSTVAVGSSVTVTIGTRPPRPCT